MKRIFAALLIFTLILCAFAVTAFAEGSETNENEVITETTPEAEGENSAQTSVNVSELNDNKIYDQVIAFVTDGAFWAKFGAIVMGVLALIGVISTNLKKIKATFDAVGDMLSGKVTKDEAEAIMKETATALKTDYEKQAKELNSKYEELKAKNDTTTAILSIMALQLVKSPNARTEIMSLITRAKELNGNVAEVVKELEAEIEKADKAMKPDTPALDAVLAAAEENSNKKTDTAPVLNMG